jgi:hypothetical protein
MNKDTRIQKIAQIIERDKATPYGKQDIPWQDRLEPMAVYKIPLEYLVYNKYNGRILSRTKSLESQGYEINAESHDGKVLIEKLLLDSNSSRNKQTLESIEKMGQEKVGIITRDGIIIDGNRRAMLLNKSGKYDYFKTVVLPVTLEENPLEIQKLETIYQMGEDEKLGYNAIEKYLKAKELMERGVSVDNIAIWMGEDKSKINEYLDVLKIMDDYLDYLGYNGVYTQLDNREDQFINLTKWLSNFYGEKSIKAFDGYKDIDVDDLKIISYDHIRAIYEGKDFRLIAQGHKNNHFFGDEKIWQSFRDLHFKNIDPIKENELKINLKAENLEVYLNDRDSEFQKNTISLLNENIDIHNRQVNNKKSADEPLKLVSGVIDALEAINQKHPAFASTDVMEKVETISKKTSEMLKNKSPDRLLSEVIRMLESINVENNRNLKDEMLSKVKEVEKIAYQMEKNIKGL